MPCRGARPGTSLTILGSIQNGIFQCHSNARLLLFHSEQVKAEKNTSRSCFDDGYCSSPSTPVLNEETAFSLV
jgi:hypothetical protein